MKHSLFFLNSETPLMEIERADSKISFENKSTKKVTDIIISECEKKLSNVSICNEKGERIVLPFANLKKLGTFGVATSLGFLQFQLLKGAQNANAAGAASSKGQLKSTMPGKVIKVLCKEGEKVEAGSKLLVIEAMKMENEILSPIAGVIEKIHVETSKKIDTGELMIVIGVI